ncbi:F-box only protein 42 isoform X2 [Bacillus rossius redtenbacheri]|uniref:F-box only protein 42 isoform X2 n=1 Tax=Bacillus rossius redtenbacheri TaxID=93214 RepID=UPI002FDE0BB7
MIADEINESYYNIDICPIETLPDEILENILSYVAPYDDLQCCAAVSKRFYGIVKNNCMYVFGGCTPTGSTFNDLWCLNLNTRQWERPLTVGSYPSPKAYTTLVSHRQQLILFGGWTHPSPFPLHQPWKLFNELHVYDVPSGRWSSVATPLSPPALAGHSASMQGTLMVVFGGVLQDKYGVQERVNCNAIWCFDTETQTWSQPATSQLKPPPRYGQFQVALDDTHLLIIGGCGGPNMVFKDVWLLTLGDPEWTWQSVKVRNPQWAAPHIWCHPTCKVGKYVVVFSRSRQLSPVMPLVAKGSPPSRMPAPASPPSHRPQRDAPGFPERSPDSPGTSREHNVNGRRGHFLHRPGVASTSSSSGEESESEGSTGSVAAPRPKHDRGERAPARDDFSAGPGAMTMAAFRVPDGKGSSRNRLRQLESLRKYEDRLRNLSRARSRGSRRSGSAMTMFVLDVSGVLAEERSVEWLQCKSGSNGEPEETSLCSLVPGKGELVMFGGIQIDVTSLSTESMSNINDHVSNNLYFITTPRDIA